MPGDAVAAGVDHIDTADTYGPHVVNNIIREALHPYPEDLVLVSKIGVVREPAASWIRADAPDELEAQVYANLQRLVLEWFESRQPAHAGLYNLAHRNDDAMIDALASGAMASTPFFPLGEFSPLQLDIRSAVAGELEATPMQVALAWLLQRSPNILVIPGTSSVGHLQENLASTDLQLPPSAVTRLDDMDAAGRHRRQRYRALEPCDADVSRDPTNTTFSTEISWKTQSTVMSGKLGIKLPLTEIRASC